MRNLHSDRRRNSWSCGFQLKWLDFTHENWQEMWLHLFDRQIFNCALCHVRLDNLSTHKTFEHLNSLSASTRLYCPFYHRSGKKEQYDHLENQSSVLSFKLQIPYLAWFANIFGMALNNKKRLSSNKDKMSRTVLGVSVIYCVLRAMPCPCLTWSVPKSRAERCLNKTPVWIQVETRSTPAVLLFRANRKSRKLSTTYSARWISLHWHINWNDPQSNLSMISSVSTMPQVTHPLIFEGIHTVFL